MPEESPRFGGVGGGHTKLEVEGTGGVHDDLDAGDLGDLVEGALLRDVRHDLDLQAVGLGLVGVADLLRLVLGPDGGDDGVAGRDELLEDVGCRLDLERCLLSRVQEARLVRETLTGDEAGATWTLLSVLAAFRDEFGFARSTYQSGGSWSL